MQDLPNSGVPFCLGDYKIEIMVVTGYGRTRRITVSSEDEMVYGLYPEELIDRMEVDVAILRETVKKLVKAAKKLEDKKNENRN